MLQRKYCRCAARRARVFFFCCGPFLLVPRVIGFLENFLLSAPGVQSVFCFLLRSVGRRDLSAGPEQKKKKHHPGCFFFAPAPGKGKGRRSPVGRRHGARAKKNTTQVFFFCSGPGERQGKEKPRWAPGVLFFFALAPCRRPTGLLLPLPFPGAGANKKTPGWCFFFLALAPCRRPTGLLLPLPFARAAAKKKTPWVVFFFLLWPRAGTGLLLPLPFPGAGAKKKTPWVVIFFCCGPARTLTHSLRAWVAMPPPRRGGVCFFFAAGRGRTGVVFFFLLWPRPDAHSLTVGWGDFGKARVVFFFFAAAPPGLFRQ